ncbi:HNH endonuclease [Salinibius halmophilus]|uniref:HNH endonuclease n=1 Tax=Salinibius halmophilus TaxID=1853216 RepID=UPI001F228DF6|nr:HNH endonuclease [Salinibius halmophilus]
MAISDEQIAAVYEIAKRAYAQAISFDDAVVKLELVHGWNSNSAQIYLNTFSCMMSGEQYQRTINAGATEYFLRSIHTDFGADAFYSAVGSVRKHLDYYRSKGKSAQPKIQLLVDRLVIEVRQKSELELLNESFSQQVLRSLALAGTERQKILSRSNSLPRKVSVTATVFIRNPHVVAEVLARAGGICEQCNCPAPFNRASDGSAYLEVHHVKPLASGGEDTVCNAIALCPNCHREAHYG